MSEACVTGNVQEQNKTDTRGSDWRASFTARKGLTSESVEYLEDGSMEPVVL